MYIMDLLTERMPELKTSNIMLVRHVWNGKRKSIQQWIGTDLIKFELWQGRQKEGVFDDSEYIVSFVGLQPGTRAQFVGVYHNTSSDNSRWFMDVVKNNNMAEQLHHATHRDLKIANSVFYNLKRVRGFADLKGRVIIEWGASTRAWAQCGHKHQKKVVKILCEDLASTINYIKFPN